MTLLRRYERYVPALKLKRVAPHHCSDSPGEKAHDLNLFVLLEYFHCILGTFKRHKRRAVLLTVYHVVPVVMNHPVVFLYFSLEFLLALVLETLVWNVVRLQFLS